MNPSHYPQNFPRLTAEVISIGDEMTSGARLDTNSQWLSQRLGDLGIEVRFHSTVGDSLTDNVHVFQTAADRVDIVVASGGLGPTRDDLTREALALASGEPLEFRQAAMDHITSLFASRHREMPERNRVQAMFPQSSHMIDNPQGTAPGIDQTLIRVDDQGLTRTCRVFALPGVPAEMKQMFDDSVAVAVSKMNGGNRLIEHHVLKFFGTGESDMEQRLGDMISRDREPRVGITVSAATISLRITAMAESKIRCNELIAQTKSEILNRVGDFYFGDGENYEQYHAIDSMLRARTESLAILELGYAAPLGDWFSTLGETPSYRGGMSLARLPGNESFAEALDAIRKRFAADWLLVVDAYPAISSAVIGPVPASEISFFAINSNGVLTKHCSQIGGHPDILQARIAKGAMAWFRNVIRNDS